MQNRYAGDVGDFGKFGLLRKLENTGLVVGLNWYLVADEDHNQDGKHIGYPKNLNFHGCDDPLLLALHTMLNQGARSVEAVENLHVYLRRFDALFHHKALADATIKAISFKRGTTRDYFLLLHEEHVEKVEQCLDEMLSGNWGRHFDRIELDMDMVERDRFEEYEEAAKAKFQQGKVVGGVKRKSTKSTQPGYINKNNQRNHGRTDKPGTGNGQWFYDMECLHCGHRYYANGHDIWLRKCPKCQGGRA